MILKMGLVFCRGVARVPSSFRPTHFARVLAVCLDEDDPTRLREPLRTATFLPSILRPLCCSVIYIEDVA